MSDQPPIEPGRYVPPPAPPYPPPAPPPYQPPPVAPTSPRRQPSRLPIISMAIGGIAGVLLLATAGFAVVTSSTPNLTDNLTRTSVAGGNFVISGMALNAGDADASNVVVTGTIAKTDLKATAKLPTVAAGASVPYTISIPIGTTTLPSDLKFGTQATWDEASLDIRGDHYDASIQGGRGVVVHTGSIHNAGAGVAPHTTIKFVASSDQAGNNKLGTGSQTVGDIAPGADVPYSVSIDLGPNPPDNWWIHYSFSYPVPTVNTGQDSMKRVGGTLTIDATLRDGGKAPADRVVVTHTVTDSAGKVLASARADLGKLSPASTKQYEVTIDLGSVSVDDIVGFDGRLDYTQTQFILLTSKVSRPLVTSHWIGSTTS